MLTVPFVRLCVHFDHPFRSVMPPAEPPAASSELSADQHVPAPREGEQPAAPPPAAPPSEASSLTERELQILAFETKWWKHAGSKEQAIRDTFGLSSTRYYQLLNGLLDNPAALAHDPVLVGRLRRLRSTRARTRRR